LNAQTVLTNKEVYNLTIGETILKFREERYYGPDGNPTTDIYRTYEEDSVQSKAWNAAQDSVMYMIRRKTSKIVIPDAGSTQTFLWPDTTLLVVYPWNQIPVTSGIIKGIPYPMVTHFLFTNPYNYPVTQFRCVGTDSVIGNAIDSAAYYIQGVGGPYYHFQPLNPSGGVGIIEEKVFLKKAGQPIVELILSTINSVKPNIMKETVFPNPFVSDIHLPVAFSEGHYQLWQSNGQRIKDGTINSSVLTFSQIPPGVYILQLFVPGENPKRIPLVKLSD
jgi:hypothetical protein